MLEKTTRVNFLFDFYKELLTAKQSNYMELYYLEDYSLGEISEAHKVSRQAVYDNINRTESMLESYESKLGLYDKFQKRVKLIEEIDEALLNSNLKRVEELLTALKEID